MANKHFFVYPYPTCEASAPSHAHHHTLAHTTGQPPHHTQVRLLNPGLILIENTRNYDSRAVSMRASFQVSRQYQSHVV
jgi:hypothetical protein